MRQKLALWIAACAMLGITACDDNTASKCAHGDKKCEQNSVYVCVGSDWTLDTACEDTKSCDPTTFTCEDACDSDSKRCGNTGVEICLNGAWEIQTPCEGASVCNANTYICETADVTCTNGAKRCNDKSIEICAESTWQVETVCQGTAVCNASTYVCDIPAPSCEADKKRCQANNVEQCADGVWKTMTSCGVQEFCSDVDFVCHTGCQEGATVCTSDGKLQSCHANAWTTSACKTGQVCPSKAKACEAIACEEGKTSCNAAKNATVACVNNKPILSNCYGATKVCAEGKCVACTNGEQRCQNNDVELCTGNIWKTQQACGSKTCNAATFVCETKNCNVGWKRCNGNTVEVCNNEGNYLPASPASCKDGNFCVENATSHTTSCVACKEDTHCTGVNDVCHSDNTCVACHANIDKRCDLDEKGLLTCDKNGAWPSTSVACPKGQNCKFYVLQCAPIEGYCEKNSDCTDPLMPECGNHVCECVSGSTMCKVEDGQAKHSVCTFGKWGTFQNCKSSEPVCNTARTACAECSSNTHCQYENKCDLATNLCKSDPPCTSGESSCTGKEFRYCDKGKWTGKTCPNACLKSYGGCVECAKSSDCTNPEKSACLISEHKCVECLTGNTSCANNELNECIDNSYFGDFCPAGKECLDGATKCSASPACTTGQTMCRGTTFMTCDKKAWTSKSCAYCNESLGCVGCLKNEDCNSEIRFCNSDFKCEYTREPTTIDWCSSHAIDTEKIYGRVHINKLSTLPADYRPRLLCGLPGEMLKNYKEIKAEYNDACLDCGDEYYEYYVNIAKLEDIPFLCMWSFQRGEEQVVACKKGKPALNDVITNFNQIPTKADALVYNPAYTGWTWDWSHRITFDNFLIQLTYDAKQTKTLGDVTTAVVGGISTYDGDAIDVNSVVFSNKTTANSITVTNNKAKKFVNYLAFDYRSWKGDTFNKSTDYYLEVYLDAETKPVYTLVLDGQYEFNEKVFIPIHKDVSTFKIIKKHADKVGTNDRPRLLIDNIRWTDYL